MEKKIMIRMLSKKMKFKKISGQNGCADRTKWWILKIKKF